MKRLLFIFAILVAAVCSLQAAHISETDARRVAEAFYSAKPSRLMAPTSQSEMRLAYTAESKRFYVFDHDTHGGFVVVAGDDRLPPVLGYGDEGDFSVNSLPPAVQYWMDEMNRQIAYMQSHSGVTAHRPAQRTEAVGPLLTTRWSQEAPYNNLCPTYDDDIHAVTGCTATATAQIMNYYEWPPVGRGNHTYRCNVNGTGSVVLSADFSQSVYQWDLMLDRYDETSSEECCQAVAKLMSDVGISMDMDYGSSSAASEYDAAKALVRYFGYSDKYYWLHRDCYDAAEWDQFLVDEIGDNRPVLYVGYSTDGGHAFVLDGFDTDGYFHVNWGWGGSYDGYFLVSLLAPSRYNFKYYQDGLFGLVPETQADALDEVLHTAGGLWPVTSSAPLGSQIGLDLVIAVEGNKLDTVMSETYGGWDYYYDLLPMKCSLQDKDGVELKSEMFSLRCILDPQSMLSGEYIMFDLPTSLEDGDYKLKLSYSLDEGENYDHQVQAYGSGKELYAKISVIDDMAYVKDCFLHQSYGVESIFSPGTVLMNKNFNVSVTLANRMAWTYYDDEDYGPVGDVYLSMLKDGVEVATSPLCEVYVPANRLMSFDMQLTPPSEWGRYDLVLNDESGCHMINMYNFFEPIGEVTVPVYVLPPCYVLFEDFENMTANSSTSDKNVQGNFAIWNFTKSGVRAPGEDRCNGSNSVMMKKGSVLYNAQPLSYDFIMAQATIFNQATTAAKYTLEYSFDGGSTWQKANTIDNEPAADIPGQSKVNALWMLDLSSTQPVIFRIAMTAGGSSATYVDDIAFYYRDPGDVNYDGEVSIADVNVIVDTILTGIPKKSADVNCDGEINIADINALIDMILSK